VTGFAKHNVAPEESSPELSRASMPSAASAAASAACRIR